VRRSGVRATRHGHRHSMTSFAAHGKDERFRPIDFVLYGLLLLRNYPLNSLGVLVGVEMRAGEHLIRALLQSLRVGPFTAKDRPLVFTIFHGARGVLGFCCGLRDLSAARNSSHRLHRGLLPGLHCGPSLSRFSGRSDGCVAGHKWNTTTSARDTLKRSRSRLRLRLTRCACCRSICIRSFFYLLHDYRNALL
jgi:hypothetical protein